MRYIDFLIYLLITQAETLKRLAAYFGEEEFLVLLEVAGDQEDKTPSSEILSGKEWLSAGDFELPQASVPSYANLYAELEGTVKDLNLPAVLEFHLWAYPFFRTFIESKIDLGSFIRSNPPEILDRFIQRAMSFSTHWVRALPLPPEASQHAERIILPTWTRFRNEVLKKSGRNPFREVSRVSS